MTIVVALATCFLASFKKWKQRENEATKRGELEQEEEDSHALWIDLKHIFFIYRRGNITTEGSLKYTFKWRKRKERMEALKPVGRVTSRDLQEVNTDTKL